MILTEKVQNLPFDLKETLRYLGCQAADGELCSRIEEVRAACERAMHPAVCYTILPIKREGERLRLANIQTESKHLAVALKGANEVIVFAATLGVGVDRLLVSYGQIDPLKATLLQGVATAYIENLCNAFCAKMEGERGNLGRRFSAGYGDLPLALQRDIFALLTPEKYIGVTLNASLLMSPSKSVTAFVGINGARGKSCVKTHLE